MYPLALEKQYQKFFVSEFQTLAKSFTSGIIKKLKSEIKADSDSGVRADSLTQIMLFIADLRSEYGNKINSKVLAGKIEKNYRQIDAWSRDKTNEGIAKLYARLSTPQPSSVTGRPAPKNQSGELWLKTVNLRNNFNEDILNSAVKKNIDLINEAYKEHFDDMTAIVKKGILGGKGSNAIAEELRRETGVNESKAKFWARDQVSKFFGKTTKLRQKSAGIPGYIWRCVGGTKTRDSHLALEGTYHSWDNPPMIQSGKILRPLHPGEDYNCRCWPEPALGHEMAEKEYASPNVNDFYFENIRPGILPGKWSGKEGIRSRMVIDINNPKLGQTVESAISEIERTFNINPAIIKKAVTVTEIPAGSAQSGAFGIFSPRGNTIMLNPENDYLVSTFIHEFGHWMDARLLKDSAEKTNLLNTIKDTKQFRLLKKLSASKSLTKNQRNALKYITSDEEIFARSFEQYMIEYKSSDAALKDLMRTKKDKFKFNYWLDEDIKKVYIFYDRLFKKEGFLI